MISPRTLTRTLGLMIVFALSLVVSADSSAAPCPNCPELPPQPHALVCPNEKALPPAGPTREERSSPKVGKIADAFSVSSTGEAVYSLSLNVPPGRLGMEPHLALSYNWKRSTRLFPVSRSSARNAPSSFTVETPSRIVIKCPS